MVARGYPGRYADSETAYVVWLDWFVGGGRDGNWQFVVEPISTVSG